MNHLWKMEKLQFNGIPVEAFVFGCVALAPKVGLIECVAGCHPLKTVLELTKFSDHDLQRLIATAAGSYMAMWVLGVRDRHYDNILVRYDGVLFHIDFGFIFGNKASLDASKFAVTPELLTVMGNEKYLLFIDVCIQCYEILRTHSAVLVEFTVALFRSLPELSEAKIREYIQQSLLLDLKLEWACAQLRSKILEAPYSVKTRLKNTIHGLVS